MRAALPPGVQESCRHRRGGNGDAARRCPARGRVAANVAGERRCSGLAGKRLDHFARPGTQGYYVFNRPRGGERIEHAALGIGTHLIEENGAYDIVMRDFDLRAFVRERDPGRIALNYAEHIGAADGPTPSAWRKLNDRLGEALDMPRRLEVFEPIAACRSQ